PYFVGQSLRLNTVVVFTFVSLCAWLWPVVGLLVATPLLVTIRTFCQHIERPEPIGDFLSRRAEEREDIPAEGGRGGQPPPTRNCPQRQPGGHPALRVRPGSGR